MQEAVQSCSCHLVLVCLLAPLLLLVSLLLLLLLLLLLQRISRCQRPLCCWAASHCCSCCLRWCWRGRKWCQCYWCREARLLCYGWLQGQPWCLRRLQRHWLQRKRGGSLRGRRVVLKIIGLGSVPGHEAVCFHAPAQVTSEIGGVRNDVMQKQGGR